jgi:O-acetyl-ADP-ribose deacetylase (regulator of RNase III)
MKMTDLSIQYVIGDATRPQGDGLKVIAHVVNNLGGWGAGFVVALSRRWKRPELEYRAWFEKHGPEKFAGLLGATQLVPVEEDVWVANIIGQHGLRRGDDGEPPVRYAAIARGFEHIADYAKAYPDRRLSVHAPRLGCGLAGGSWEEIEPLLHRNLLSRGVPVTIYDLP